MRTSPLVALAVLLTAVLSVSGPAAAQSLPPSFAALLPAGASLDVVSVGAIRQEKLPNGLLAYYEHTENCDGRANAQVASLRGHSRKGTTILSFSLLMNTGIADARAKAVEILDTFAKFDVEAAKRSK